MKLPPLSPAAEAAMAKTRARAGTSALARRQWTEAEDQTLRLMYADRDMRDICSALDRTAQSVMQRASKLGLRRLNSPNIRERSNRHQEWMRARRDSGYRNTGRANIGDVRVHGGRLMCKVADTGDSHTDWKHPSHAAWEAIYGPIPEGHVVRPKDGDPLNSDIENLELRTASENRVKTNVHYRGLPPEILDVLHLRNEIRKTIKRKRRDEKQAE